MTDTWRRALGALILIAAMGTSTCQALFHVGAPSSPIDRPQIGGD